MRFTHKHKETGGFSVQLLRVKWKNLWKLILLLFEANEKETKSRVEL